MVGSSEIAKAVRKLMDQLMGVDSVHVTVFQSLLFVGSKMVKSISKPARLYILT